MRVTSLTNSQFEKLKRYNPGEGITNTEAKLFIMGSERSKKERQLFKVYYDREGLSFSKKLYNINILLMYKKILNEQVPELITLDGLGTVGGIALGPVMPFIEKATNLETFLKDSNNPLEDKINYLKDVGTILEKLKNIEGFPYHFYLGDMHEANFIIDKNGKLRVCDLDSACLTDEIYFPSKYLFLNPLISEFPMKYKEDDKGFQIPSRNTDLYCYIMMFLNTIAKTNMYNLNMEQFYHYINYLEDLGFSKNILNVIEKIYCNGDNENILPYLDEIPIKNAYQAHHLVYNKRTGRDLTNPY